MSRMACDSEIRLGVNLANYSESVTVTGAHWQASPPARPGRRGRLPVTVPHCGGGSHGGPNHASDHDFHHADDSRTGPGPGSPGLGHRHLELGNSFGAGESDSESELANLTQ
jgi:hypothetical protein